LAPSASTSVLGTLRGAIRAGVTLIDALERNDAAEVVRAAGRVPGVPARLVVTVGVEMAVLSMPTDRLPSMPDGTTVVPVLRSPSGPALRSQDVRDAIGRLMARWNSPLWGAAWASPSEAALNGPTALEHGARLLALPASLLSYAEAVQVGEQAARRGAAVIVLDPMASGSLDGSFLDGTPLDRPPTSRPPSLDELSTRLGPVTRLGFLTEGRRRSLAQAAVRFVLGLPGVVSACCVQPSPRILAELAAIDKVPPLSEAELERVGRLAPVTG
jgi:hypothetical protein